MTDTNVDSFALQRFVDAQASVYQTALAELRNGRKRTHWMWFVFPQVDGLGHSAMAREFAIKSRQEAFAYLQHPVLGKRLVECTEAVNAHADKSANQIMGSPDDVKLRSSMTLFAELGGGPVFRRALDLFYAGRMDQRTLDILSGWPKRSEGRS